MPSTNLTLSAYKDTLEEIQHIYDRYSELGSVIVIGDMNAQLSRQYGAKNSTTSNDRGNILQHFLDERQLTSVNSQSFTNGPDYTFVSGDNKHKTLIDHILVENHNIDRVYKSEIISEQYLTVSDHLPVQVRIHLMSHSNSSRPSVSHSIKWKQVNNEHIAAFQERIQKSLKCLNINKSISSVQDIEKCVDALVTSLLNSAKNTLPHKEFKNNLNPYWKHGQVKNKHNTMRQTRKIWTENGKPRGMEHETYRNYKESKKSFKREMESAQKQYMDEQFKQLNEKAEIDIGLFFKAIREQRRKESRAGELRVDGKIVRDTDQVLKAWTDHYSSLAKPSEKIHFDEVFKLSIEEKIPDLYIESFKHMRL